MSPAKLSSSVGLPPSRHFLILVLGVAQIFAWGSSYYLLAVLAQPIVNDTGWPLAWVVGGLSFGLLVAGIVSPHVGDSIQRLGGRLVLSASTGLMATGLAGLALSPNLALYIASWLVLGVGMGAGLYDAAFATVGRLYGLSARTAIATLTLFGGFASTVCWPLSALFVSMFGWRNTCLIYAAIHLAVLLPLYICTLPTELKYSSGAEAKILYQNDKASVGLSPLILKLLFILTALVISIGSAISAMLSVHLLIFLQSREIALAAAVALTMIVGPSQVGARAIEMLISRFYHPIWTKFASTLAVATGIGLLWIGAKIIPAALIFYGAGIGIASIARGTLPLAIFGPGRYASVMGRIAMPSLIMQAASPSLGAWVMDVLGTDMVLGALFAIAIVNVALVACLYAILCRYPRQV